MALPADLDFTIKFDQTNTPANFELEDITDYASLSIADEDVRGNYSSVTDPLGNVIHNDTDFSSPDVDGGASLLYTGINIPTDTNGEILAGQYSFTYGVVIDDAIIGVNTGAKTFTVAGDRSAEIGAATTIDIVRSTLNNGTYTVVSAVFGGTNTVVTVVEAIPSSTADGSMQYSTQTVYSKTKTVTYSDLVPVVSIGVEVDCFCGNLLSSDLTDYTGATIVSRTHTVKYPAALSINDVVSSGAVITVTPIYTKTWTTIVETELTIDIGGGNTISAIITGSKDTVVECDLSLCDISCCMLALNNRYLDNRTANPPLAAKNFADLTRMMQLAQMFRMAYECDQHDEAAEFLSEIKKVGNCTDACTCSDDQPQQVIPICGGSVNNVQVIAGTGITVTTTFQNNNYVYQVGLSSSIQSIINSVRPQNVVAGTGISVAYALVAGTDTWTITNTATYTAQNRMEFLLRVQYTAPNAATLTPSNYLVSGSNMNASATIASTTLPNSALNNNFRVNAFQVAANNNYKVDIEMVQVTRKGITYDLNSTKTLDVEILNKTSGSFDFRIIGTDGTTYTNGGIKSPSDFYFNIKISE